MTSADDLRVASNLLRAFWPNELERFFDAYPDITIEVTQKSLGAGTGGYAVTIRGSGKDRHLRSTFRTGD